MRIAKRKENRVFLTRIITAAFLWSCLLLSATGYLSAQAPEDLDIVIDITSPTTALPKMFRPNIDLSGRGLHRDPAWPQELAAKDVLEKWNNEIKFTGYYRLQYNLWEISQLSRNPVLQKRLKANYEEIIKKISDSGGTVILDLFGTPAGLGKILDKKSPPLDLKGFKFLLKNTIRELSCNNKYRIWYEVWSAPDLEDFFLGRKQEYFNLYRMIGEAVRELERERKMTIPLGGPSTSWWFQNFEGNNTLKPEASLIYEFMQFCHRYRLPLDFISWHGYSTSPAAEKEETIYHRPPVGLIRDWLGYFSFNRDMPLVITEWNFDRGANILAERKDKAYITASYIPARIKNMFEAGIDNQIYYCLEDFQSNKEGIDRNVGVFYFDPEYRDYKGGAKVTYNVMRMLSQLGKEMLPVKLEDDFVGVIATKEDDAYAALIYNYIDPDVAINYLSRNIAALGSSERRGLLAIIKSDKLAKILTRQFDVDLLHATDRVKKILKKAIELNERASKPSSTNRTIKLTIANLKDAYLYSRFVVDSGCNANCKFVPQEEKEINATGAYQETLNLPPYSVCLIIVKKKSKEALAVVSVPEQEKAGAPEAKEKLPEPAPAAAKQEGTGEQRK